MVLILSPQLVSKMTVMANNVKTVFLLGLLSGIILFVGSFWGERGLIVALLFAILMNFGATSSRTR
jgi:hypothetical protein